MKTLITLALSAILALSLSSCGAEASGVTKVKAGGPGVKVGAKAHTKLDLNN